MFRAQSGAWNANLFEGGHQQEHCLSMDELGTNLRELYENTPVLVAAYDAFDRLRYANRAFRCAFYIEPGEEPFWPELMRRNVLAARGTVISDQNFEAWLISAKSRRGKQPFRAFETDLVDGRWLWMTETVQPNGWMLCIASDITGIRAEERAVRQDRDFAIKASYTDELTGIANRRYVMGRIEEMTRSSIQHGIVGCVGILDIDNFKQINDRFGHATGDLILRDFARRILEDVRRTDCFGRIGGEEFALVLPDTQLDEALLIMERMLAIVRMAVPMPEHGSFRYTFSAGIAEWMAGETATDIYARADRALYAAKIAGRDRIEADGLRREPPAVVVA